MIAVPSNQPGPPAGDRQWLVHCSPERTLVARRHESTTTLVKIFEQGSLLEAEQEAELAVTLAQPGVVTYTSAGLDPVTNKPCVRMEFFEGSNLERKIADSGPLTSAKGAQLILQLTRVLADFHNTSRPLATNGVVHRDVKPANVFLVRDSLGHSQPVLIDLEHAIPLQVANQDAGASTGFTGGTHGYSAPEAYHGAYPTPAFDIFGLGATFFYVLTGCSAYPQLNPADTARHIHQGCSRLSLLLGQPPVLRELIANCLAIDPRARPDSTQLIAILEKFLEGQGEQDAILDCALQAIQAGEFTAADAHLENALISPDHDDSRHHQLIQLASNRSRMLARIGGPLECELGDLVAAGELHELARQIAENLPRIETFLRRYPLHRECLDRRQSMLSAGHSLLERVLPEVAALKTSANFEAATQLLERTTSAAIELGRVSGGLSLPTTDPGHLPGPLLRNPGRILDRSMRDVAATEAMHGDLVQRLEDAEAELDLPRVGVVVDEITAIYSGASQVAAQMRDRLHRLDFYVQRIAAPNHQLEQLSDLLELAERPHRLDTVQAFLDLCRARTFRNPINSRAKGGMRGLLDTMEQLLEEFPSTHESSSEPVAALAEAMCAITERAWEHVEDATEKLKATPVPIRPVQNLLNRIDGIRLLESFLDIPDRSRERLQDEIERVRLRLDQARTTRDNIARGAQEAMDRGHLTTALFDMERAVQNFEGEVADDPDDRKLAEHLAEAKRRKLELETETGKNHRLSAHYAQLLEDDDSQTAQRLKVLEDRAAVLERLIEILGTDRGAHYQTDLRDVILNLVQEEADQGERQLDEASSNSTRAEIAKSTLDGLVATISGSTVGKDIRGRTKRILSHWEHKYGETRERRDADTRRAEESKLRERRNTQLRVAIPSLLAAFLVLYLGYGVVYANPSSTPPPLASFVKPGVQLEKNADGKLSFDAVPACNILAQYATTELDHKVFRTRPELKGLLLPGHANRLTVHITSWKTDPDTASLKVWAEKLGEELAALDKALESLRKRANDKQDWLAFQAKIIEFGRYAHLVGLSRLATGVRDAVEFETTIEGHKKLRHIAIEADLVRIRGLLPTGK